MGQIVNIPSRPFTMRLECCATISWYMRTMYARNDSVLICAAIKSTNTSLLNAGFALQTETCIRLTTGGQQHLHYSICEGNLTMEVLVCFYLNGNLNEGKPSNVKK